MTNLEAYFREAEELQNELEERDSPQSARQHIWHGERSESRYRAYSREQLPGGCILYKMAVRHER
jgi:hypothetical protein